MKANFVESTNIEQRYEIRTAETVLMRECNVEARIGGVPFHVGSAQAESATLLQAAIEIVDNPQQRVLRNVLNHVRHMNE